ncbi:hypothetical protein F895_00209 [Acinetobacter sp. CIP 64.2]|uniref:hypothetical protein n=1 Tax=Acinetobacter sp. CIP 64.2 TaxID=1217694 RepID=UPI000289BEBD|nr:hypothetical protein [Acinetobacter sp. CIP 64.2]ENX18140.1 hypothetical protein F895_00209 [Acinetobacter sp. CIP 64.2]
MNENDLEALNSYFQEKKNTAKTVNAFYDKTLEISLETNSGCYKTTDFNEHLDEAEDLQFCAVRYSSSSSKILIYRLGSLVKTCDFKISSRNYSVDLDLNIYHFNSGGKKKISELFYREPDEALSPLLFINDNLFNNFTIFDSNINRAKRSAESMPQMIGYVRVYSSNKDLDFNSDRTNFVENELTRKIKNDLMNLNRKIQEIASSLKAQGKSEDAIVITGKARSDTEDIVDHKEEDILSAAKINLKNNLERRYQIPSSQIDLKKFISSAIDSYGEPIPFDKLNYFEAGKNILPILSSVDIECVKNIKISFLDSRTGLVIENGFVAQTYL